MSGSGISPLLLKQSVGYQAESGSFSLACRYVDMIVTEGVRDTLRARALVCSTVRRFLESRGFLEVETPVLEATCGGADARPFVTYHNALSRTFTLRIATYVPVRHALALSAGGRGQDAPA